jgi:hypothetical protein
LSLLLVVVMMMTIAVFDDVADELVATATTKSSPE